MKIKHFILILVITLLLTGCSSLKPDSNNGRIHVITSLFPQYDFVREIAKDKVDVSLLLPPGVESHSFDPTPSQIIAITKSDLFIYTNKEMEPWIDKIVENVKGERPLIVDSSLGIQYIVEQHTNNEPDNHSDNLVDPHVWLDPLNAKIMLVNILNALISIDPDNEAFYRTNANDYLIQLDELNNEFTDIFTSTTNNTIVYGGHFAFGYLASRFHLNILSPYTGFSPDSEPTANAIAELIKIVKEKHIKIIFYEELIDPKVARVISSQTNTEAMLLHGAHNLTAQEMKDHLTYISIMKENARKLKEALSYE